MKLLYPIVAKTESGPVRVIAVVRDRLSGTLLSSGYRALSYLDLVYEGPARMVMLCDSASAAPADDSIESAMAIIAAGGADLVVATDLSRISWQFDVADRFINYCAAHDVRVIVFEDHIDTADPDWRENLTRIAVESI